MPDKQIMSCKCGRFRSEFYSKRLEGHTCKRCKEEVKWRMMKNKMKNKENKPNIDKLREFFNK